MTVASSPLPQEETVWLAKLEGLGATGINLSFHDKGGAFNYIFYSNKLHTICHLFKMFQEQTRIFLYSREFLLCFLCRIKNHKDPMTGYTIVTYQINTSYISDSKGNCVNIEFIIIKGQLFSIPKYPGQACSERQATELNSDCSRKARTYPFQKELIIFEVILKTNISTLQFCWRKDILAYIHESFKTEQLILQSSQNTVLHIHIVCMCHKDFAQKFYHSGKHCWLPFVCGKVVKRESLLKAQLQKITNILPCNNGQNT